MRKSNPIARQRDKDRLEVLWRNAKLLSRALIHKVERNSNLAGWIGIALFSSVVLIVLLHSLGYLSLWMDEGFYYLTAETILEHGYPLFPSGHIYYKAIAYAYVLALFSLIFGLKVFTLRLVSVLATVILIFLLYALCKHFFNKTIAFVAAVTFSLSVWVVEYSRTVLYFAPLQLICIAGLYWFYKGFMEEKKTFKYLATGAFLIAPLVHQLGMSVWFCFLAFGIIKGTRRFFQKDVLLSLSLTTVFFGLVQLHEFFFWKVGYVYYKSDLSLRGMIEYFFGSFSFSYFKEFFRSFPMMSLVVFAGFFLLLGIRMAGNSKKWLEEKSFENNWLFVSLCLLFPLIFLGFFRTHVQPRYLYHLYPLFLVLFVVGLYKISQVLILLVFSCFRMQKRAFCSFLSVCLFLALLFFTGEGMGIGSSFRIVKRQYGDPVPTDTITRSGRYVHYDHRGPGEYVRHFRKPDDLVIAIHVVFQYIYAGRVDYWLWSGGPGTWDAWEETPDGWKDFYIGARWINNLSDLKSVLEANSERRVWLITSPSILRRDHINAEIAGFIQSHPEKRAFRGKDGMSEVYLWNERDGILSGPGYALEGEWIPLRQGRVVYDEKASRGTALFLEKSKDKKFTFSVLVQKNVLQGRHKLVIRAKIGDNFLKEKILGVAVASKGGREQGASFFIAGNHFKKSKVYQDFEWDFYLNKDGDISVKILYTKEGNIWIDGVDLK